MATRQLFQLRRLALKDSLRRACRANWKKFFFVAGRCVRGVARVSLAKLDNGKTIRFFDMDKKFEATPGKSDFPPSFAKDDHLHLVAKGYQVWADTMMPIFDEMRK